MKKSKKFGKSERKFKCGTILSSPRHSLAYMGELSINANRVKVNSLGKCFACHSLLYRIFVRLEKKRNKEYINLGFLHLVSKYPYVY